MCVAFIRIPNLSFFSCLIRLVVTAGMDYCCSWISNRQTHFVFECRASELVTSLPSCARRRVLLREKNIISCQTYSARKIHVSSHHSQFFVFEISSVVVPVQVRVLTKRNKVLLLSSTVFNNWRIDSSQHEQIE